MHGKLKGEMMEDEKQLADLIASIPQELDQIVTQNRDKMQLVYATTEDLSRIQESLTITHLKGTLSEAFLYKRVFLTMDSEVLCLVGFNEDRLPLHTSTVVAFDVANQVALTANGSYYKIHSFKTGAPSTHLVFHICYMFIRDGVGDYFGVLPVYY